MRPAPLEVEDKLPAALFPSFNNTMKQSVPASSPPFAAGLSAGGEHKTGSASSAASASSMPAGPPSLASFRSSLSGASLASFAAPLLPFASLPAPSAPLLSRGLGHSSAHLSLVALDPESSVLDKSVLHRLKLQMIKGQAKPAKSRSVESVTSTHAEATVKPSRKRKNLRAGDKPELASLDVDQKKQKTVSTAEQSAVRVCSLLHEHALTFVVSASFLFCLVQLSLVPKQSLLTLEKQLSRDKAPTAADLELAAFAIARHLVEFADDLATDLEPDSEDEAEFAAMVAGAASPKHRAMVELPASIPLEWISPMRSLSEFRMQSGVALDGGGDYHSTSSTPSFDPAAAALEMERRDSAITMTAQEPAVEAPATQVFHPSSPMLLEELEHMPDPDAGVSSADVSAAGLGLGFDLSPLLTSSSAYAALSSALSPLASPKASPSLLAHLASADERASQLGSFSLDGPMQSLASPTAHLMAHTTTSQGQHVSLIQHAQMAW